MNAAPVLLPTQRRLPRPVLPSWKATLPPLVRVRREAALVFPRAVVGLGPSKEGKPPGGGHRPALQYFCIMPNMHDAAYQGTRGANSEDAAIDLLSASATLLPRDTLEDVFTTVSRGEARYGIVPIENTLAGSIHRCYDLLFEHDLKIVGETVRHIVFALIAPPGVALDEVRKALSHPVALAQCEQFFRRHPQIQPVSVYDTAGAVENVMRQGLRDSAAVASRRAAQVYGGVILADAIQDHLENYTRFLLITPVSSAEPVSTTTSDYKTTIVFSVGNAP